MAVSAASHRKLIDAPAFAASDEERGRVQKRDGTVARPSAGAKRNHRVARCVGRLNCLTVSD